MPENFYILFLVALVPFLVGGVYYHPKVLGTAWMRANNFTTESLAGGNMLVIFAVSYIFGLFIAGTLLGMVIHQVGAYQMMSLPELEVPGSALSQQFNELMAQHGNNFRSFGHGALHGGMAAIMFALPVFGMNSLFERRGWKYIGIHTAYWFITLLLMGGIICQTIKFAPLP